MPPNNRPFLDFYWPLGIIERYRLTWFNRGFCFSAVVAIFAFAASIAANTLAGVYATERASNSVTDIILSNTPVFDVDLFFVWGAILLIAFVIGLCLWQPKRLPFILYSLSLFYIIRAMFVTFTHLAPFPSHDILDVNSRIIQVMFGGGDMFFSGHTGAPFLLALIFWKEKVLRFIFLGWSIFFGIIVLLGHIHYTIDVASAFFITYSIYRLALWLFQKEAKLFEST